MKALRSELNTQEAIERAERSAKEAAERRERDSVDDSDIQRSSSVTTGVSKVENNNEGKTKGARVNDDNRSNRNSGHTRNATSGGGRNTINVTATAYTAYCAGCSGITATGHDLRASIYKGGKRVIAVSPSQIPLGSTVRVTAGGQSFMAIASDTGSDIVPGRIDIAYTSKSDALRFGRQSATVEILK